MDVHDIERHLLSRTLPDLLPADQGWVMPDYDGLSIANLPATVGSLFGTRLPWALPPLPQEYWEDWQPGLQRVVLIILDALGLRLLQSMWAEGDGQVFSSLAETGRLVPLTSVFPSTTDAALVSLRSGVAPAAHGWLAYTMYLREYGLAANAILLTPVWSRQRDTLLQWGMKPENLVPVPTLAATLLQQGVTTRSIVSKFLLGSGFTKMLYQGVAKLNAHLHASDLWVQLRSVLRKTRGRPAFLTAYWGGLDTLGHAYGHDTEYYAAEFRSVSRLLETEFLAKLPAEDREGTLLLITADHGQMRMPADQILTADEDPELSQHLMAPVLGESRAAFVYPRPGRTQAICHYLQNAYPGWFTVVDASQALEAGLMGKPIADETRARAGSLWVLPHGNRGLQGTKPSVPLVSRHGGLTADEMLVPLIGTRLEALTSH